jgi:hypothetical protein
VIYTDKFDMEGATVTQYIRIESEGLGGKPGLGFLMKGNKLLESLNIPYWISAGTALGLYRDFDLIPHDTDIDVEILGSDVNSFDEIIKVFKDNDFILCRDTVYKDKYMQLAFYDRSWAVVYDIYIYYDEGGDNYINHNEYGILSIPKRMVDTKEVIGDYILPSDTEEYLRFRYGDDWKIPKTSKGEWEMESGDALK